VVTARLAALGAVQYCDKVKRLGHAMVTAAVARVVRPALRYASHLEVVEPLEQDDGLLADLLARGGAVPARAGKPDGEPGPVHYLLNGHLDHDLDIVARLSALHQRMRRGDRVVAVSYATTFRAAAVRLGLTVVAGSRHNALTSHDLAELARLSGFEVVMRWRVAPWGMFSLASVIYLRPIRPEADYPSISVIVPLCNEEGHVQRLFDELPRFPGPAEFLFVEGQSTDDTVAAVRREIAAVPPDPPDLPAVRPAATWRLLRQPGKGKNDAVTHGLLHASGEVCVILDADLSVPPALLLEFYTAYLEGVADFVNGSRLLYPIEGGGMRLVNRMGNVLFARLLSWTLHLHVTDALCGTKLFRRDDWRRMCAWREAFGAHDPFGDFDLLFATADLGIGCVNLPVRYRRRTYGHTNIHRFRDGLLLLGMVLRGVEWFYRRRYRASGG